MKKLIYTIGSFILGLSLYSCDMDTAPTNAVEEDLAFQNLSNAEKVLNGTWSYLFDSYYSTYQNPGWVSLLLTNDAMGNDAALQPGKYGYLAHYSFTNINSTSSGTASGIWGAAYKGIDNMNHIISRIDKLSGDESEKNRIKAQAHALRGYLYLNLVTSFSYNYAKDPDAPSVPIYTEPTTGSTVGKKRSSVKEVYKQAEDDLTLAYNLIGDYNRGTQKHKFNKPVISGVLARLYLQSQQWDKANKFAKEADQSASWMSKTEYLAGFNDRSNAEWIWGHGQTSDQSVASYSFNYLDVSSSASYYYSFMADPYFKDFFDEDDARYSLFEWDTQRYIGGLMYKKFKYRADKTADISLMRKAEMVLIEAESLAELNKTDSAIIKLNELRTQRGAKTPDLKGLSKTDLVEEILIERRKELFGEGFALSDILRRQKTVARKEVPTGTILQKDGKPVVANGSNVTIKGHTILKFPDGTNFTVNSPYYLFAIPNTEVQNNPNL